MCFRAWQQPDGTWLLNGGKRWIGGVQRAGLIIVVARTDDSPGRSSAGVTTFLVEGSSPRMSAKVIDTLAIRGLDTNDVEFDDVRLPSDALVGKRGEGFSQVTGTLNRERINCAASALGIARGALAVSLECAGRRHAFGQPIGAFQACSIDPSTGP